MADGTRTHDNRNHNPGLYQLSYSHHRNRSQACAGHRFGLPDGTRTHNPQLRRLVLYPVELRAGLAACAAPSQRAGRSVGRGERIRTSDILLPKQARYQAASHPGGRVLCPPARGLVNLRPRRALGIESCLQALR